MLDYLLLFVAGLVAGVVNTLAGGGSMLTVPLLIFLGLPATVANGTNRIAVLLQGITSTWGFQRHGLLDRHSLRGAVVPVVLGTVAGTWIAVVVGDLAFQRALAVMMILLVLWTLWNPDLRGKKGATAGQEGKGVFASDGPLGRVGLLAAWFVVGVYGGFIQAGLGFVILAVTSAYGFDLIRGNALKAMLVIVITVPALLIFQTSGKVDWPLGLALAAGNGLGGILGVRLGVSKGNEWVRRLVTITIIAFAIKLLFF